MLPRKNLISLKTEFPRIRREGKIYDSASFGLVLVYGNEGEAKVAFVVSKKIDRRSTRRHEVKRKLSRAAAFFLPRLGKNVELVFLAKQKAVTVRQEDLQKELEVILKRARLL